MYENIENKKVKKASLRITLADFTVYFAQLIVWVPQ